MEYKSLIISTKKGNFQNAINILKDYHQVLEVGKYINIVVCVCQACLQPNASSNFSGKELVELLNLCLANVGNLGGTNISQFLNASFYIWNYMLDQNEVELVCQNPHVWNPPFLSNCQNDDYVVFKNHCVVLCQTIILLHKNKKNTDCDTEKLCMLLMKMIDRLPLLEDFSKKDPFALLKSFFYLSLRPAFVEQIYKYQFRKIFNNQPIQQSKLKFLLDGLIIITIKFTKTEEHKRAASLIQSVIDELKTKFTGDVYHFLSALKLISELLIKNNLQPTNLLHNLQIIDALLKTVKSSNTEITEFYKLSQVILLEFYALNKNDANVQMNSNIIVNLFEILLHLGRNANTKFTDTEKCPKCTKCESTLDFRTNISFLQIIVYTFREHASKVPMSDHLLDIIENTFTCTFNLIEEFRGCCESWMKHWCDTMTNLYNTAVSVFRLKTYQKRLIWLGKFFLKEYFARWNQTVVKSIQSSVLHSLLNMLCQSFDEIKQLQDALRYSAFNVFTCDKKDAVSCYCCSRWIEIKTENNQTCKNITMVSVLTDTFLRQFDFEFTNERKLALLNVELQVYRKYWPSKIPMSTCCLEINKFGCLSLTVQALVFAWGLQDDIPSELNDIISKLQKKYESMNLTVEQQLDLAVLYLLEYRTRIKTARINIEKSVVNEPPETTNSQNYLHSQEVQYNKLDCVSNYEELYLSNHEKNLTLLIKSLKLLRSILPNTKRDLLMKKNIYAVLMSITHTFQLQGDSIYYLKGMLLCKKVAEIINNNLSIVETIGYVLEISNINSDDFKALSRRAEDLIETIISGLENQQKSKVVIYYVHKANAFLRYGFFETAIMAYENAKQLYSAIGVSDTIADIKLRILEFNLRMLPCRCLPASIDNHFENHLSEPSIMLQNLADAEKAIRNSSCTNALYINILMSCLVHYNRWTHQVRELRCSGKTALAQAKYYVLPLRAAQIFDHLIAADLMGERWDDYQVKLNGLTAILNVSADGMVQGPPMAKVLTPVDNNICSLVNNFEEMALDAPSILHQSDCGSPILSSSSFKMPAFLKHDDVCTCFPCISVEYQNLTLNEVVSKANLWASRDNTLAAEQFFKGGIKLYKNITRRQKIYREKVMKCIELDLCPSLEDLFAESYAILLYDYGEMLVGTRRFSAISDELITILEKNRYRNIHLYLKALSQKICHLSLNQTTKLPVRVSPIPSTTETVRSRSRTPENLVSTVAIAASISPKPKSKRILGKAIKFDLSDNDESNERKKSASKSPIFNIPKTPAVTSKIRVYEPKSVKSVKPVVKSAAASVSKLKLPVSKARSKSAQPKNENERPIPKIIVSSPNDEVVSSKKVIKKSASESGSSSSAGAIRRSARPKK